MSAPPEKKFKANSTSDEVDAPQEEEVNSDSDDVDVPQEEEECTTISIDVASGICSSPVSRVKGYPWRLLLHRVVWNGYCELFVRCEKSMEAELWSCEADFTVSVGGATYDRHFVFDSTRKENKEFRIKGGEYSNGTRLEVEIKPRDNGNKWRCRPIVAPFAPRDGCLVIDNTKLYVNKESLVSQSPYFDRLFNGEFKEKNMAEIPIEDVSVEEFTNLMEMVYGENGDSVVSTVLTRENVHNILDLADMFELKIVEDGVVNTLLSTSSSFSIHERLFIADKHGLTMCKERIISQCYRKELIEVVETPEYRKFSMDTKDSITKRMVEVLKDC